MSFCYSVDSEYKPLKAVLMARPCPEMGFVAEPQKVLYSAKVDYPVLVRESDRAVRLYQKSHIRVFLINSLRQKKTIGRHAYNLVFTRDHFLMTPTGAILSRMASVIRRDEVFYARKAIENAGVPVRAAVQKPGTFEGADALWVTGNLVLVAVGNRTNAEGFRQIKKELGRTGIECVRVLAPIGTLHLLGALQCVDADLALARVGLLHSKTMGLLKQKKINIIRIPESFEVKKRHAMNFVTVTPRSVVMASACPESKKMFERAGIKIIAEIPAAQWAHAGGGLACATGILARF